MDSTNIFYDRLIPGLAAGAAGAALGAAPGALTGHWGVAAVGAVGGGIMLGTPWGRELIGNGFKRAFGGLRGGAVGLGKGALAGGAALGAAGLAGVGNFFKNGGAANLGKNLGYMGAQSAGKLGIGGLKLLEHAIGAAEASFIGAANLLAGNPFGGVNKARNTSEAFNLLFPYRNNPDLFNPLTKSKLMGSLKPNAGKAGRKFISELKENNGVLNITGKTLKDNMNHFDPEAKLFEGMVEGHIGGTATLGHATSDARRVGLNPKVVRRLTAGAFAASTLTGLMGAMGNDSPEPTVYYSGGNIRHMNDMGADAHYAKSLMGRGTRR